MVVAPDMGHHEVFTKDEEIAMLLNAYYVRYYVQNEKQHANQFVILIEFDVRESPAENGESTLELVVTTCKDGLEGISTKVAFSTEQKTFNFHSPKNLPDFVRDCLSHSWDVVRGLLPLGLDFILTSPPYQAWIEAAQAAGRKVEILLYDCSSVFGGRGNPQTTDWQLTKFMYYMQGFIRGYDVVMNLIRFPDGVTGRATNPSILFQRLSILCVTWKWSESLRDSHC